MTDEEYRRLQERVVKGKAWILKLPNKLNTKGFFVTEKGKETTYEIQFARWNRLSKELIIEDIRRGVLKLPESYIHSKAWHEIKFQDALRKWKSTRLDKRGPDPRFLSRESFI